jgi:anthranilate phosphoribosyltransferase
VGSRATSSLTGAYEFLSRVGVNVDIETDDGIRVLNETGFGYFNSEALAPNFFGCYKGLFHTPHALMFGFSPMLSPIQGDAVLYGIAHPDVGLSAQVLCELGFREARIYSSTADGVHHIDEIGIFGTTFEGRVEDGQVGPVAQIDVATTLGLHRYGTDDVREAATAARNVEAARRALAGAGSRAHEDLLCVNAAAILRLAGECDTLAGGYEMARAALRAGRGSAKLEEVAAASRVRVTA